MGQSLQNLTFTELSKSSVFVVKSLAPTPLPLLVGVLNTTNTSFGSGWHATFIRVKGTVKKYKCIKRTVELISRTDRKQEVQEESFLHVVL